MPEHDSPAPKLPDPEMLAQTMARIAERSQRIVQEFAQRQRASEGADFQVMDPKVVGRTFAELYASMLEDPRGLVDAQMKFWQDYASLWGSAARRMLGEPAEPVIAPDASDRRFKDEQWQENPAEGRVLHPPVRRCDGPLELRHDQSRGAARDPRSRGENLLGPQQHARGPRARQGPAAIKMTDLDAFEVGENIATTPGKVVYQNELMQLIQYAPTTETVTSGRC
jgi:polyhydroxyalkanoate synthase subunit PhaC